MKTSDCWDNVHVVIHDLQTTTSNEKTFSKSSNALVSECKSEDMFLLQNLEKISQKISFVRARDVISNLKPHSIVLPVSDQWKRGTYIEWEIKKKRARISLKRAYINYVCLRVRCKLDEVSRERHAYSKVNIHHAYSELNMQHATMSLRNSTVKGIEPPRFLS